MKELKALLRADFAANPRGFDRMTLLAFRLEQARWRGQLPQIIAPLTRALYVWWVEMVIGAELPAHVEAGPGLRLPHGGRGVILHPNTRIGAGVTLYHRVTIGVVGANPANVPAIEDKVYIGTGASVIGRVTVGTAAKIGAGAVVTRDVATCTTVVGVPARPLRRGQQGADGLGIPMAHHQG